MKVKERERKSGSFHSSEKALLEFLRRTLKRSVLIHLSCVCTLDHITQISMMLGEILTAT